MAVSAKDQLAQMARYHAWATERLLTSIMPIPDEFYSKPCGLFSDRYTNLESSAADGQRDLVPEIHGESLGEPAA